eukprot:11906-Chlamydomonas_euryale.AAC.4
MGWRGWGGADGAARAGAGHYGERARGRAAWVRRSGEWALGAGGMGRSGEWALGAGGMGKAR